MGMFDSVYIDCPECHNELEIQTKSGHCLLHGYLLHKAPMNVLSGVIGNHYCDHCGKPFKIELIHKPIAQVRKLTDEEQKGE